MCDVRAVLRTLCLPPLLAAQTLAAEPPPVPGEVFFDVGGRIYRFDYSRAVGARQAFAASRTACLELSVTQAVFGETPPSESFAFSGTPSPAQIVLLGASRADVLERTGQDLGGALDFVPTLTHRVCRSESGFAIEHRFGQDAVRYEVPWDAVATDAAAIGSDSRIRATVNGRTVEVDPDYLYRLAAKLAVGDLLRDLKPPHEFELLAASLRDPVSYRNALWGLLWASELVDRHYRWPDPSTLDQSCAWPCYMCGFSSVSLVIGGTAVLTAGCGGAPVTIGASCIAAGMAYMSLAHGTFNACLNCCVCLGSCIPPGGGGTDPGDPPDDPGQSPTECPAGYHDCCNVHLCCSDLDPPESCP
jgi:hypothetical protein